jgi:hypothetical protein
LRVHPGRAWRHLPVNNSAAAHFATLELPSL